LSACKRRSIACRAQDAGNPFAGVDTKELSRQLSSAAESSSNLTSGLKSGWTDLSSTALSTSQDLYKKFSETVNDGLAGVPDLSVKLADVSEKAQQASSEIGNKTSEASAALAELFAALTAQFSSAPEVSSKLSGRFSGVSDKVFQLTTEVANKSSDLSSQLSNALEGQLSSMPDIESRLLAGADALQHNFSSVSSQASGQLHSEIIPNLTHQLEVVKGLIAAGQLTEALTTPGGIGVAAVATAGVVLGFSSAATKSEGKGAPTPALAVSNAQNAVSDAESARAWIEQWRSAQAGGSASAPAATSAGSGSADPPPSANGVSSSNGVYASENGSGLSLSENGLAEHATTSTTGTLANGSASLNGAEGAPEAGNASAEDTFAEQASTVVASAESSMSSSEAEPSAEVQASEAAVATVERESLAQQLHVLPCMRGSMASSQRSACLQH
jgi:trimeric autotransporter adhesin